ncbi:MAG: polyribonucleotide nucleotidyltransferase, partial [bacterium]
GFIKREGRPSDAATLNMRLIDRAIRPLFDEAIRREIQVTVLVLSNDQENPVDILGLNAVAMALYISDIPFATPLAATRVGLLEDDFIAMPHYPADFGVDLDLVVAGTADSVMMVEAGCLPISEDRMLAAMKFAQAENGKLIKCMEAFQKEVGKTKVVLTLPADTMEAVRAELTTVIGKEFHRLYDEATSKKTRDEILDKMTKDAIAPILERHVAAGNTDTKDYEGKLKDAVWTVMKKVVRKNIIEKDLRPDGRKHTEIRPISCVVGFNKAAHGCAIFTRGETQAMTTLTLGSPGDAQTLDNIHPIEKKRYMHQYGALPFCYGETGPHRGPGRREIGHGALAERAVFAVVPPVEEFPYTLRLVTDILSSNGSTSMASTCASTLALMDAGVPIKAPVAGIAMGLIKDGDKYQVLSDIMGTEDFMGDMDFKVAGTAEGITALQMDMKVRGISMEILTIALNQALDGRFHILGKMLAAIPAPREDLYPNAPRIEVVQINPELIGSIIGPGGKTIRKICAEFEVQIDVEDTGKVFITSNNAEGMKGARGFIEDLTREIKQGEVFEGKAVRVEGYGAFIQLTGNKDGLLHISQMAKGRVDSVDDILRLGDILTVKVKDIDPETGKISLTRQGLDGDPSWTEIEDTRRGPGGAGGGRPGGGGGGRGGFGGGGGGRDRDRGPSRDFGDRPRYEDRPPRESSDRGFGGGGSAAPAREPVAERAAAAPSDRGDRPERRERAERPAGDDPGRRYSSRD